MDEEDCESPVKNDGDCKTGKVSLCDIEKNVLEYDNNMDSQQEEELCKTLVDTKLYVKLPRLNVPEKIIICLDLCADNDSTPFRYFSCVVFLLHCPLKKYTFPHITNLGKIIIILMKKNYFADLATAVSRSLWQCLKGLSRCSCSAR